MVGKTCEKGRFWAESEKEKELRRVEMTMMYMNCHEWKCGECDGDWLLDWRNETGSWFQRWGEAKRNKRFVIFKKEYEGGREMVTEEEEWMLRGSNISVWQTDRQTDRQTSVNTFSAALFASDNMTTMHTLYVGTNLIHGKKCAISW